MKFKIKKETTTTEEIIINVELSDYYDNLVVLKVNGWNVFELRSNGNGHLIGGIPNSGSGLQIDSNGRIILE